MAPDGMDPVAFAMQQLGERMAEIIDRQMRPSVQDAVSRDDWFSHLVEEMANGA